MKLHLVRAVTAVAFVTAALLASTGTAGAQVPYDYDIDATCDTTTGTYDVTVTLSNNVDEEAALGFLLYESFNSGGSTGAGNTEFFPPDLPALGTSSGSFTVPGDTVLIEMEWGAEYAQFVYDIDTSEELGGDCTIPPSTTTTAAPTTTTTAAPAVVQPRFTG